MFFDTVTIVLLSIIGAGFVILAILVPWQIRENIREKRRETSRSEYWKEIMLIAFRTEKKLSKKPPG
jgi:hypothetical protein